MSRIMVLGATGALGSHVAQQAVDAGHDVSVLVRTPRKLPATWRDRVKVQQADISALSVNQLAALLGGHDAVINTAGRVSEGDRFVALVAHIVDALEILEPVFRPVSWFMAGAGLLNIAETPRRGVDLPVIRKTYWPHAENFKRLEASSLDFRLLCSGPMVEGAPIGLERLRVSVDQLPVQAPAAVRYLPDLLLVAVFASRVPEMIIPYADAAILMLKNLEPGGEMSRHRIGVALPIGMKGKKDHWTARAP